MRGEGHAWGAISFANALPTGTGAAAAIGLEATVRVHTFDRAVDGAEVSCEPDPPSPLVLATVRAGRRAFVAWRGSPIHVAVDSKIPSAQGLKSSSAVSVAILRAMAEAAGAPISGDAAARIAAEVALAEGGSATGAFDDAMATATGGLVVTENTEHIVLRHATLDPRWSICLWLPGGLHGPSAAWGPRFRERREEGEAAVGALLRGEYLVGMQRNTELVESILGYAYGPLRERLQHAGALGSGVSGLGPALAVIIEQGHEDRVLAVLPSEGRRLATRFVPAAPGELP